MFRRWLCFCLGKLCIEHQEARMACLRDNLHTELLKHLLTSSHVEVRAAAVYALGTMLGIYDPHRGSGASSELPPLSRSSNPDLSVALGPGVISSQPGHAPSASLPNLPLPCSATSNIPTNGPSHPPIHPNVGRSMTREDREAKRRIDLQSIAVDLLRAFDDASPLVRREAVFALYLLVTDPLHLPVFARVAQELVRSVTNCSAPLGLRFHLPCPVSLRCFVVLGGFLMQVQCGTPAAAIDLINSNNYEQSLGSAPRCYGSCRTPFIIIIYNPKFHGD